MNGTPNVPYQAYKPKRHSRNVSNNSMPNGTPPRRSQSVVGNGLNGHATNDSLYRQRSGSSGVEDHHIRPGVIPGEQEYIPRPHSLEAPLPHSGRSESLNYDYVRYSPYTPAKSEQPSPTTPSSNHTPSPPASASLLATNKVQPPAPPPVSSSAQSSSPASSNSPTPSISPAPSGPIGVNESLGTHDPPAVVPATSTPSTSALNGHAEPRLVTSPIAGPSSLPASPSSDRHDSAPRKTSTFRHVPLRNPHTRLALPSSPLRPADSHARTPSGASSLARQLDPPRLAASSSKGSSAVPSPTVTPHDRALPAVPNFDLPQSSLPPSEAQSPYTLNQSSPASVVSQSHRGSQNVPSKPQLHAPVPAAVPYRVHTPSAYPSPTSPSPARSVARSPAPYRPGFQPKGVYRPRTDEFFEARKARLDVGRIERTRLERRLEKLINLHFPPEGQKLKEKAALPDERSHPPNKRLSSIFEMDLSELRSKSASDLWRDMMQSQKTPGNKNEIRAAEQKITPWEEDADVSQCPLCSASFHPLTNRKHHCRLCGRIVCSLPVKYPQRPQTCSLLFVTDPKTGRIEEVGEGVDYGVRRRTTSTNQGKTGGVDDGLGEDEKFLKGVRICRDCRPVLLRQQYKQEAHSVPFFFKLYEAFVSLETDIEAALPQFQELMLSLSKQERPTPEASAARKRLLEAFGQYDALARRIRQLPCPNGKGSSQDRMQAAIAARANVFLQKHMFPLQSLPKPNKSPKAQDTVQSEPEDPVIDPDSEVARVLQPLLEQEALLESFVEEAKAHRKFEDAKTLKTNLQEIRTEINCILANAEAGMGNQIGKKNAKTRNL